MLPHLQYLPHVCMQFLQYLWYCLKTNTVTFSEFWHRLGTKVLVLVTAPVFIFVEQQQGSNITLNKA